MYVAHYHLREPPFSIAPDPAFLYLSARHQEALGHLLYGTGQYGGFVQLTGEVGTGKTTIVRSLLAQKLANVDIAMIHNPRQNEQEFVASICDELGVSYPRGADGVTGSIKTLVDALNEHLLKAHAEGRRTVLIIDEAQNLPPGVLEQVRLLTNLETDKEKLLRIMLIGQPELAELLARPDLRQLASRITARFHLTPLPLVETIRYIIHRLHVAGGAADLFSDAAMRRVHHYAKGIPRRINIICDRALLGAYSQGLRAVTPQIVDRAAVEVLGENPLPASGGSAMLAGLKPTRASLPWIEGALAVAALLIAGMLLNQALAPRFAAKAAALPGVAGRAPVAAARPAPAPAPIPVAAPAPVVAAPAAPAAAAPAAPANATAPTATEAGLPALRAALQPLPAVMARLIGLWTPQLQIPRGASVCAFLASNGLDCYKGSAHWDDLRQMNRPAILTLGHEDGTTQYVLLRRLDSTTAVIDTANGPLSLTVDQLNAVWSGEFLLLWQRPVAEAEIGPKSAPESIAWLRRALAAADGKTLGATVPTSFGPELRAQLQRFQAARGLDVDGVAGSRTLIALADLARQPGTPTLEGPQ